VVYKNSFEKFNPTNMEVKINHYRYIETKLTRI